MDKKNITCTLATIRKHYPSAFIGGSYGLGIHEAKDVDFVIPVPTLGCLAQILRGILPSLGRITWDGAEYEDTKFVSLRAGDYNFLMCLPEYFEQHRRSQLLLTLLAERGVDVRDKQFRIAVHEIVRGERRG